MKHAVLARRVARVARTGPAGRPAPVSVTSSDDDINWP